MNEDVVNNEEFYEEVARRTGLDVETCTSVLKESEKVLADYLVADKTIQFKMFGKFLLKFRKGFTTSSKFTDKDIVVDDYFALTFKPSNVLLRSIEEKKFPERY